MFLAKWAIVIVVAGMPPQVGMLNESIPYADRAACEKALAEHTPRMPDLLRGKLDLSWTAEIEVKGACEPKGEPA